MNVDLNEEAKIFRERFMSHVPPNSPDLSLPVLKGHLLAEELLVEYISAKVAHPEHIRFEANHWGFATKLDLAAALSNDKHHDIWVWHALAKLNTLRNRFSHGLEPKGIEKVLSEFRSAVLSHAPEKYSDADVSDYGCIIMAVTALFLTLKSAEGKMA